MLFTMLSQSPELSRRNKNVNTKNCHVRKDQQLKREIKNSGHADAGMVLVGLLLLYNEHG